MHDPSSLATTTHFIVSWLWQWKWAWGQVHCLGSLWDTQEKYNTFSLPVTQLHYLNIWIATHKVPRSIMCVCTWHHYLYSWVWVFVCLFAFAFGGKGVTPNSDQSLLLALPSGTIFNARNKTVVDWVQDMCFAPYLSSPVASLGKWKYLQPTTWLLYSYLCIGLHPQINMNFSIFSPRALWPKDAYNPSAMHSRLCNASLNITISPKQPEKYACDDFHLLGFVFVLEDHTCAW